jgi:hypothetical protein
VKFEQTNNQHGNDDVLTTYKQQHGISVSTTSFNNTQKPALKRSNT